MLNGYLYACTYAATTSSKFRNDLLRIFPLNVSATMSILELGTHSGITTAFFADIFAHVIAVDRDVGHLQRSRQTIGERRNVAFFSLDLYQETWSQLLSNIIDVVFIDAAHDYVSVMSDTM
jgi:Protein-L-isoaspartate carboxylmethyltransferase